MTGRERILATLRGEETDRLCWAPLVDAYFTSSLPEQGYEELSVPDAVRLVGADVIERHCPTVRQVEDPSIARRTERRVDGEREIIETSVGNLTIERHSSRKGHTSYISKHPVVTVEDVRALQYVKEHTRYVEDFAALRERDRRIGDDGIATSSGPTSPIQEFLQTLCGVQQTIYLLKDHPDEVETCFEVMHEKNREAYRLICEGPAEVVIDYEDTSSTVISPTFFRKYCAPFIDDYADICHEAGKIFVTHMCGKISAFSEQIGAGRQDGVDSVCPPPTGDTWSHEARQAWGPEKVIIGGLDPPTLERVSAEETREYVASVLDQMPTFRRFILSTGDATAYRTPVENLRATTKIVNNYPWK
ncbi:MAG: uroporphyrinogen decarboxylase family protein [Anaerolineae bacterium]|jgi:uroporphyrinogen-III decarboxylase